MIDILFLIVLALITWCVASEGAWGAALMCLSVLFSGLLAMNFFEPTAAFLERTAMSSPGWRNRTDVIALLGLFGLFLFAFRLLNERLMPGFIQMSAIPYEIGRWSFGLLSGYLTAAILMTALHVAPFPREFMGFAPEIARRSGFVGPLAPDYQWLALTQFVSENSLSSGSGNRVFDLGKIKEGDYEADASSFPLRYATRRELGGAGAANAAATGNVLQRQTTAPKGGGF